MVQYQFEIMTPFSQSIYPLQGHAQLQTFLRIICR